MKIFGIVKTSFAEMALKAITEHLVSVIERAGHDERGIWRYLSDFPEQMNRELAERIDGVLKDTFNP